jgi:hypothetical protein
VRNKASWPASVDVAIGQPISIDEGTAWGQNIGDEPTALHRVRSP